MTYEFNKYPPELNEQLEELVSKPKIVGYYSVDGDKNYLSDSSRLLYYKPPPTKNVYFDLNKGIESAIHSDPSEGGRISHLFEWIKFNHRNIQVPGSKSWIDANFICSCALLVNVMCFPYYSNLELMVCAAKWKGSIYLSRIPTQKEKQAMAKRSKKLECWHIKFQQFVLSDAPDKDPDPSKPVVECDEFRCMYQRRFGNHSVLFTTKRDGIRSKTELKDPLPLNDLRFVELRTARRIETQKQDHNFRKYNLLRWWAKSFLLGNEKDLCGFRDDDGIVHKLKNYRLPEMVELSKAFWDPVVCVNECREFLNHVASTVVDDCDKMIYKYEKKPGGVITTEKVSPQSEYAFIPSWFLEDT